MAGHSPHIWLLDIRGEIAGMRDLTKDATFETFAGSRAMTRAVQHALLIIAEAAKHVPSELKALESSVPWRQIHGLGNMLRDEYRRIDPVVLWSVVTEHLAPLDTAAAALLDRVPDE
ncbi:HepT-like ribonuclease domain-containing protein [Methylobacterium frigidaeris]|uniref:DUF86 domain-containing protein n=1 Tax=Methylobacterium frigidaeris TaxID=2038277 RepID=A0AA37H958_9HYPH|nr:HepT-like ribonuclease domain-containing protein [Methylobacterium frigidaeris]PIK68871.1 hypothetical protein CS379_32750 [Methylobacterium frigidaeris]GJD61080.1 hypothetical protein MPEAHAMD_1220 [Methylobacterium frigidaeris]